jgi:DNA polymerase-3 subunit delta
MKYQNLKSFQKHLASAAPNNFCRVYFVGIADDFERAKVLDSILACIATPDAMVTHMSGNEIELRDLFDAMQSPSLFSGAPIIVLDEAEKLSKKQMEAVIACPVQGYLLIGSRTKAATLANGVEKEGVVLDLTDEKPWDREKRLADLLVDALSLLFERLDKDLSLLESEIDKLICYVGEQNQITREDVLNISAVSRNVSLWQTAEEVIWENGEIPAVEFHAFIPALRSQLHLGLTLATLIETRCPADQWNAFLPKIWPKTLEKRSSQAARLGSAYFRKGQEMLYEIELLSRGASTQYRAMLDLFRTQLRMKHA